MDSSLPAAPPQSPVRRVVVPMLSARFPITQVRIPDVSIIVPARNEETSLGDCLASLNAQTGVAFEIIVVDDGSADRTREIAQRFARVRVISPGPLAAGWTGKNNAVAAGAKEASAREAS